MSSLRRIGSIVALAAAVLLAAGCGGGKKETATTTVATETTEAGSGASAPALDPSKSYTVALKTNQGTFAFDLEVKDSPHTTASFADLVKKGFFDGLTFHRIVPGFVIQGGDPNGDGTGGPGYTTVDTPPNNAKYTKGVVAMAKTQTEPPGTSGSQFFVVTGADIGLPPDYALLGKVSSGMDVVDKIDKLGDPATEQPTKRVVIEKATVSEG
jgi:peptidyl-prolyl cis-trans isomerase B (cyclophilin B)